MKKSSSMRLGIDSNLSLNDSPVETDSTLGTNSAALAKAERRIGGLREENKKLRSDLSEISIMYHQLVREAGHEHYDERRVMVLKAQMIQLERQVVVMATAQGARAATLMDVENALAYIADSARSSLEKEKAVGASVGSISIPRAQLTSIVESAESSRVKLYKNIENSSPEKLERPLLLMDKFIKQTPWEPVTLMDVCSGKLEHLNLKHVSKLESQLAQLYKKLVAVKQGLSSVSRNDSSKMNKEVPAAVYRRLGATVSDACNQLNTVTQDLLDLTLLVPAAPWPPLQRPRIQDLTTDDVIKVLPSFPRSKAAEGRHLVEALLKSCTLTNHMASLEKQVLTEELQFHQAVYDLQDQYTQALFGAVRDGYSEFETNTQKLICQPLAEILKNYWVMRDEASEESLRKFLAVFKQHADQLEDAVQILSPGDDMVEEGKGTVSISEFGEEFLKLLNYIHSECKCKRDTLISDLDLVKGQRGSYREELNKMFGKPGPNAGEQRTDQRTCELGNQPGEHIGDTLSGSTKKNRQGSDGAPKGRQSGNDDRGRIRTPSLKPEEPAFGVNREEAGAALNGSATSATAGDPHARVSTPQMGYKPTSLKGLSASPNELRISSSTTPTSMSGASSPNSTSRIPTMQSRPCVYSRGTNPP